MSTPPKLHCCIHGHFYQPPRENPWLDDLEREPSAAPHHNWNSRITEECYTPNAWARVLDGTGHVVKLYNNYAQMSFNVGPTLTCWLGKHVPETLDAIVRADRESIDRLGQGNAIAQVYNHTIIPLCNERDKYTQVRWGKRAFEATFGRRARGMWLAETAVDADTMEVLADEGIDFTILSPFQARRFRVDGIDGVTTDWQDCSTGTIPTGRAYRYTTNSGKIVHVFFYDGAIAKGIAFERLLSDASHLVDAIRRGHAQRPSPPEEPWLVHTATDGESYGHHFRFGDMALAAAHASLESQNDVEIVNYATFLDRYGSRGDVELHPVSAWSCAHGVGRWERDCGCRMNADPQWNQRWRTGLRHSLNGLRDGLALLFERAGAPLLQDPWDARDAYIDVVLGGDAASIDAFLRRQSGRMLSTAERERALTLLELQRCALLMFTSCGWFFDDVAGPEAIILLRYASRALSLAARVDEAEADRLELEFMAGLANAESNIKRSDGSVRTALNVYVEDARAATIGADRVAVSLALTCALGAPAPAHVAAWRVTEHDETAIDTAAVPCVVGRVSLLDQRVERTERLAFAVVGFGGLDWRGVLVDVDRLAPLQERLSRAADTSSLARVLDAELINGGRSFTLKDAPADVRDDVARRALLRRIEVTEAVLAELLLPERSLLRGVVAMGGTVPTHVRGLLAHALSRRARDLVDEIVVAEGGAAPLLRSLRTVIDDAVGFGAALDLDETVRTTEQALVAVLTRILASGAGHDPEDRDVERARQLLSVLPLLVGDRSLLRTLKAASALSAAASSGRRLVAAAQILLPTLNTVCRSRFPVPQTP